MNDKGLELIRLWSFQNASKCHDSSISVSPVWILYVFFDEGQNMWDDVIFTTGSKEHEADSSSFTRVPVIVVIILILKRVTEGNKETQHPGQYLSLHTPDLKIKALTFHSPSKMVALLD